MTPIKSDRKPWIMGSGEEVGSYADRVLYAESIKHLNTTLVFTMHDTEPALLLECLNTESGDLDQVAIEDLSQLSGSEVTKMCQKEGVQPPLIDDIVWVITGKPLSGWN